MWLVSLGSTLLQFVASWWIWISLVGILVGAYLYLRRRRLNYFALDRMAGLSSDNFSLDDNIAGGDDRQGLGLASKLKIRWIMFRHGISFDEARVMHVQDSFALNDINPDGTPRDPKAIFFT